MNLKFEPVDCILILKEGMRTFEVQKIAVAKNKTEINILQWRPTF